MVLVKALLHSQLSNGLSETSHERVSARSRPAEQPGTPDNTACLHDPINSQHGRAHNQMRDQLSIHPLRDAL